MGSLIAVNPTAYIRSIVFLCDVMVRRQQIDTRGSDGTR